MYLTKHFILIKQKFLFFKVFFFNKLAKFFYFYNNLNQLLSKIFFLN